jgi:hypothetical protein
MSVQTTGTRMATKRPVKGDPNYITCSNCGEEQWSSYRQCQKCGVGFVDPPKLDVWQLESKQNLTLGVVGGMFAAAIAAILWAAISVMWQRQLGWMAIGVGFLVGLGVRRLGQGTDRVFGITGGALSFLGCLAGNLLTVAILISQQQAVPVIAVLLVFVTAPEFVVEALAATFSPIDLLFYGLAIVEGYRFSFRPSNVAG